MKRYKTVEDYISGHEDWKDFLPPLREIILSTDLVETVKWGSPVYTFEGKNICGLGAFKSYVGLWFFQGALLKDEQKKLINAQEGTTKALRQWRFQSANEIDKNLIVSYIMEAVENQKAGKSIKPSKKPDLAIPQELKSVLDNNDLLNESFNEFSPFKKREYIEHISSAKKEETRLKRIEKIIPLILGKKGLNDKYRK